MEAYAGKLNRRGNGIFQVSARWIGQAGSSFEDIDYLPDAKVAVL